MKSGRRISILEPLHAFAEGEGATRFHETQCAPFVAFVFDSDVALTNLDFERNPPIGGHGDFRFFDSDFLWQSSAYRT